MRDKSRPTGPVFLALLLALATAGTRLTPTLGLTFVQPLRRAQVGVTHLHATAADEASEAVEVSYANHEKTDSSVVVGKESLPLNVSKAASIRLRTFGKTEVDCQGEGPVFIGLRVATNLRRWHTAFCRRLNGDVAVRPEMLKRDDGGMVMRLHVAPVTLPQEADGPHELLKAPADDEKISPLSVALLSLTLDQKKAVRVQGVGKASVNRIMKAISRANQARLRQSPDGDVLWGLPDNVKFEGTKGVMGAASSLDIVLAPQ